MQPFKKARVYHCCFTPYVCYKRKHFLLTKFAANSSNSCQINDRLSEPRALQGTHVPIRTVYYANLKVVDHLLAPDQHIDRNGCTPSSGDNSHCPPPPIRRHDAAIDVLPTPRCHYATSIQYCSEFWKYAADCRQFAVERKFEKDWRVQQVK